MIISDELKTIISYACDESMRTGSRIVSADHLMLGVLRHLDNAACSALCAIGVDLAYLKHHLDTSIACEARVGYYEDITFSRNAESTLGLANFEASLCGEESVDSRHLLMALLRNASVTRTFLEEKHISRDLLLEHFPKAGKQGTKKAEAKAPAIKVIEIARDPDKIYS